MTDLDRNREAAARLSFARCAAAVLTFLTSLQLGITGTIGDMRA